MSNRIVYRRCIVFVSAALASAVHIATTTAAITAAAAAAAAAAATAAGTTAAAASAVIFAHDALQRTASAQTCLQL
jgi:hypothetical protein